MENLSDLIYRRIEQLKPKKVHVQPKKVIITEISRNIKRLKGDELQKWRAVARMLQPAKPVEATRIYLACLESDNFDRTFFSAIKSLNQYKDKKLKQNKLFNESKTGKNK